MAQKITYCLVTSYYDEKADAYVDEWHKDKLYELTDKSSLKSLAIDALNFLVKPGVKVALKTFIDRESLSFSASDLGITE